MENFIVTFSQFSKMFENYKEQNYPEEMIKSLRNKKRVKHKAKIAKPNFKG